MSIDAMQVHGWKFQLTDDQLLITSEQDPNAHLELSAKAAFSLLDYLYQYRDDLAKTVHGDEAVENDISRDASGGPFVSDTATTTTSGLTSRGL